MTGNMPWRRKQEANPVSDAGLRRGVPGGAQIDGFITMMVYQPERRYYAL